ncbi:MAG: translocation/assembly module TamB domain-containing protein, partial [Myxococcales bacterium]|nr:translocation/assembly module TamB domain-containing protein [Myxococcales bacterium]
SLWRAGEHALLSAQRIVSGAAGVRVEGARIEGLGDPATVALETTPAGMRVRAEASRIDLSRIGRLTHSAKLRQGKLALDADVDLHRDRVSGRTKLDLDGGDVGEVHGISAHVDAKLEGRRFSGEAHVKAGDVATIDVSAPNVAIAGAGALSAAGWRHAWGDVTFDFHGNLARIEAIMPPEQFPFAEASGDVVLKGHLVRTDERDPDPDLKLGLVTNGLRLTPKTQPHMTIDGVYVMPPPAWRLAGVDFDVDTSFDGDTRDLQLAGRLHDPKGPLAELKVQAEQVPVADLFGQKAKFSTDLQEMPFDVHVTLPTRGLGTMPDILKQNYVTGKLTADLTAKGTMRKPVVHMDAKVQRSHVTGTSGSLPLEFALLADYDGAKGKVTLNAKSADRDLLQFESNLEAVAADLVAGGGADKPWTASAKAHFGGFPLEAIGSLADHVISGQVNGDLIVADVHKNGRAEVALSVDSLTMGGVKYRGAKLDAKAGGRALDATMRVDGTDGFLETKAEGALRWGAAAAPSLDSAKPLVVGLSAKNFRMGGLFPFVSQWLDEFDGRLDADTRVELDPVSRRSKLSGSLALDKGVLEATAGGGELHDVSAKLTFSPDGVVTLEKMNASAMSGRLEASGSARLGPAGLAGARAVLVIPSDAPFPLSAGGAQIGDIDGRVEVAEDAGPGGKGMSVKIDVPHLRVMLPDQSPNSAQSLGEIPGLHIGAYRGQPLKFVLVPLDPVKKKDEQQAASGGGGTAVKVHLADIEVVRRQQLQVDLVGDLQAQTGAETKVTGQIHLKPGGTLSVQGRTFKIESGTVSFVGGDPGNPEVVVKAGWTAPDGTVVYANFVGPLKTGKVTLTSEPALPQEEIVELLLFGSTGGKQAQTPSADAATSAIGTVGGEAAAPLNHALDQIGLGAVSTKVDTSDSSAPRPEVEVQISREISLQIAVVLGQPPPGVNPDRTLLTVDWRFLSRWSLSSTLGDAGTTIFDVLWRRRY